MRMLKFQYKFLNSSGYLLGENMKRKIRLFLYILLICIVLSGCKQSQQQIPPAVVNTKVMKIEEIIEKITTPGRIIPVYEVEVVARIDGYLQKKFFNEGDYVKKGELLFQIEPNSYAAKVSEASANLRNAQAVYTESQKNLHRAEELVKQDFISKMDYDANLASRDRDRAAVDSAKAALSQAQINYGYTKIYSPVDGKISKLFITEGNYVTPASGKIATVVSLDPINVDFSLKSKSYLSMKKASKLSDLSDITVKIQLADDSEYPATGKIKFYGNEVDVTTGAVDFRASFPNKDKLLLPGDFVNVICLLNKPRKVILVPQEAVQESEKGKYVFVIDENKHAQIKYIKVDEEYKKQWIVAEGLEEGDNVVIEGVQSLQPDSEVIFQKDLIKMQKNKSPKKRSVFSKFISKTKSMLMKG